MKISVRFLRNFILPIQKTFALNGLCCIVHKLWPQGWHPHTQESQYYFIQWDPTFVRILRNFILPIQKTFAFKGLCSIAHELWPQDWHLTHMKKSVLFYSIEPNSACERMASRGVNPTSRLAIFTYNWAHKQIQVIVFFEFPNFIRLLISYLEPKNMLNWD